MTYYLVQSQELRGAFNVSDNNGVTKLARWALGVARASSRAKREGDTVLPAIAIMFPPAAGSHLPPPGQSTGTKIVWRGLSPDDLVMWPLPVVSSTRAISPAPMWRVSPTGITAYLKNGGTLEKAAAMANHASTRTTQLL
jgi:hypothetical protein